MKICIVAKKEYKELRKLRSAFEISDNADVCIAIGGDGTFIHAVQKYTCPVLPVRDNEPDSTGYYSDIGIDKIDFIIKMLKEKKYKIESIGKRIFLKYKDKKYYAVNECYLSNSIGEVSFKIYEIKDNKRYVLYPFIISGDGVIITGRVGSTAYNRNVGGPILIEKNLLCITFINPDSPYKNSLVVGSDKIIEIEVVKYKGFLRYDSFEVGKVDTGEFFTVGTSNKDIHVVKLNNVFEGFGDKLNRIIKSKMQKA